MNMEIEVRAGNENLDLARMGSRAMTAYFRHTPPEKVVQPDMPEMIEIEGLRYVVVHRAGNVLAVFRVQNTGQLRRMRRPPKPLLAHYKQRQDQQQEGQADE